jgi:putative spermidine/putrescine transport system ATP-binding protein
MPDAVPSHPRLGLRDLRKTYAGTPAVDGLSLDIHAGELVSLLGPSGSGKTTTLLMVAGFVRPDSGEVRLDGIAFRHTPPHRRNVGMVFQDSTLLPHLSVAENVAFPLRMRRWSRARREAAVLRALDMVRLSRLALRMPAGLSGGQAQRVALARALVFEPRLILLDEPIAALDRQLREEMQYELRSLHARLGAAMLYVTHDQAEALTLSDRIAVLVEGRIRQVGTPAGLYDDPADAFVAGFLGDNNRLGGTVEAIEDGIARIRLGCGPVVEAQAAGARPGHRCVVSIRPERIALAAIPAEEMGEGAMPAILRDISFHGDHLRIALEAGLPGTAPVHMVVKRPAGAPMAGLAPGQPAALAWQPHHARAFEPEVGA